jgi:predicted ATP-binding protein involved in virulence
MPEVKNKFDIRLRELKLSNFRRFEELSLSFDPQLTVFIGRNGAGKSTVLDGVASLLKFLIDKIKREPVNLKGMLTEKDIRNGTKEAVNTLTIYFEKENAETPSGQGAKKSNDVYAETGVELTWYGSLLKSSFEPEEITEANAFTDFDNVVSAIEKQLKRDEPSSLPVLIYYRCDYATDAPVSANGAMTSTEAFNAYDDALSNRSFDLGQFSKWYKWREDLARDAKNSRDRLREITEQAVYALLSDEQNKFTLLKTKALTTDIGYELTVSKNGEPLSVNQFSSGEKMLFALVADLARRLALANPGIKKPLGGNGIVLIDEIDLHLHPAKQREVIPKLIKVFPNIQFVITTHSPFVFQSVKSENRRILNEGEILIPDSSEGLSYEAILEEYFQYEETFDLETETDFEEFYRLKEEILLAKISEKDEDFQKVIKRLSKKGTEVKTILGSELRQLQRQLSSKLPV